MSNSLHRCKCSIFFQTEKIEPIDPLCGQKKQRAVEISAALVFLVVFSNLSTLTFTSHLARDELLDHNNVRW